eukprot:scaffold1746_cov121-Isochrysis_galbana.AAC.3
MSISSYASDLSAASLSHSCEITQSNPSPQSGMVQPVVNEMFATVHAAGSSLLVSENLKKNVWGLSHIAHDAHQPKGVPSGATAGEGTCVDEGHGAAPDSPFPPKDSGAERGRSGLRARPTRCTAPRVEPYTYTYKPKLNPPLLKKEPLSQGGGSGTVGHHPQKFLSRARSRGRQTLPRPPDRYRPHDRSNTQYNALAL